MTEQLLHREISPTQRNIPTVELFATGLQNPTHMEWTPDGQLLVSEHTAGRVKDVSRGGDMSEAPAFAYGLRGPSGIMPVGDRIYISDSWSGRVLDITDGGDANSAEVFAEDLMLPYGLAATQDDAGNNRVFVGEKPGPTKAQLTEITGGGTRSDFNTFVSEIPSKPGIPGKTPLDSWPERWQLYATTQCSKWAVVFPPKGGAHFLYLTGVEGSIVGVPQQGGNFGELVMGDGAVAWGLHDTTSIKDHPYDGHLYVVRAEKGDVVAVDPRNPRNYWFDPPVVTGLNQPTCARFADAGETMFVCSSGDGVIWKVTHF